MTLSVTASTAPVRVLQAIQGSTARKNVSVLTALLVRQMASVVVRQAGRGMTALIDVKKDHTGWTAWVLACVRTRGCAIPEMVLAIASQAGSENTAVKCALMGSTARTAEKSASARTMPLVITWMVCVLV